MSATLLMRIRRLSAVSSTFSRLLQPLVRTNSTASKVLNVKHSVLTTQWPANQVFPYIYVPKTYITWY